MSNDHKFKLGLALAREQVLIKQLEELRQVASADVGKVRGISIRFSTQDSGTEFVRAADYERLRLAVLGGSSA